MRQCSIGLAIFILTVFAATSGCTPESTEETSALGEYPVSLVRTAGFTEGHIDLGKLTVADDDYERDLVLTYSGTGPPPRITAVRTNCGCSKARFKDKKWIDRQRKLTVFISRQSAGEGTASIGVSLEGVEEEAICNLKWLIQGNIRPSKDEVDAGPLQARQKVLTELDAKHVEPSKTDDLKWSVAFARSSQRNGQVDLRKKDSKYELQINAGTEPGAYLAYAAISIEGEPELTIPIRWRVVADLDIYPKTVVAKKSKAVEAKLICNILNVGDDITKITATNDIEIISWDRKRLANGWIEFTIHANRTSMVSEDMDSCLYVSSSMSKDPTAVPIVFVE